MNSATTNKYNFHKEGLVAVLIRITNAFTQSLFIVIPYMVERYTMSINLTATHYLQFVFDYPR